MCACCESAGTPVTGLHDVHEACACEVGDQVEWSSISVRARENGKSRDYLSEWHVAIFAFLRVAVIGRFVNVTHIPDKGGDVELASVWV